MNVTNTSALREEEEEAGGKNEQAKPFLVLCVQIKRGRRVPKWCCAEAGFGNKPEQDRQTQTDRRAIDPPGSEILAKTISSELLVNVSESGSYPQPANIL